MLVPSNKSSGSQGLLTGDVTTNSSNVAILSPTTVVSGNYTLPSISVDGKGRITSATNGSVTGDVSISGTTSSLSNTAVTPGSYTNANITVDVKGRIVAASNGITYTPSFVTELIKFGTPSTYASVLAGSSTDSTAIVANAISDAKINGSYLVYTGTADNSWRVTSFSNVWGVEFIGAGKILIPATNGSWRQLNSEQDRYRDIIGREYLSHFHKRLMSATPSSIVCTGDSTTVGTGITAPHICSTALPAMATKYGMTGITGVNAGHGGMSSSDWLTTYLAADLVLNPDLYIVRWGINDPYIPTTNLTADQTITNIRTGLATCRASKTLAQMSIILMMPSSVNDNANNRDERVYERLVLGFKQAARDYGATFFNTFGLWRDAYAAIDWMDAPFADARHIHPADVEAMWINSALSDLIYPTYIRVNG